MTVGGDSWRTGDTRTGVRNSGPGSVNLLQVLETASWKGISSAFYYLLLQGKLVGWRRLCPGGSGRRVLGREGERNGHLGLRLGDGGGGGDDGGGLGGRLEDGLLHLRALHALHDDGRVRLRLPRGPRLQRKGKN